MRERVQIYVPPGYRNADEFIKDCQFERAPSPDSMFQGLMTIAGIIAFVCVISACAWLYRTIELPASFHFRLFG